MVIVKSLACAGAIALMSASAMAQDSASASFDWAGFYAGLHLGYGANSVGHLYTYTDPAFVPGTVQSVDTRFGGVVGGLQAGHNWTSGSFVFGVEADLTFSGAKQQLVDVDPTIGGWTVENTLNDTATLRARVGHDFGNTIAYATGGLAGASLTTRQSLSIGGGGGPDPFQTDSNIHLGYALGVGIEHAVSEAVSLKAEYMYLGLGDKTFTANYGSVTSNLSIHTVRFGLNYHF